MYVEANSELSKRPDMNWEEAEATCNAIREGLKQVDEKVAEVREQVLLLHDRKGWAILGYPTWKACVEGEFNRSYRHVNRQLQAAIIEQEIAQAELDAKGPKVPSNEDSLMGTERIPETHLRPLTPLPKGCRAEVWKEAKETAPDGKVTAKHVQKTVNRKRGKPDPAPSVPRSQFKTEVNGKRTEDPPHIAMLRAAGKIAPDVVVEVTEPEPDEDEELIVPPEETTPESEDEWLAKLPLSSVLPEVPLSIFRSDARRYFRMKAARDAIRHHNGVAGKGLRKDGEYTWRISSFLTLADPRDWIRCAATDYGGCGGVGYTHIGQCTRCHGRGYTIDNRRAKED